MSFVLPIFIKGAGGGIGRLLSLQFAAHGAKLVLWDINKGKLQKKKMTQHPWPGRMLWLIKTWAPWSEDKGISALQKDGC